MNMADLGCCTSHHSATTRITGQMDGGKKFGVGHVTGLQDLERQIFVDLFQAIDAQYPIPHRRIDSMALEDTFHTNHISSHKACFGRESLLQEMLHLLGESITKVSNHWVLILENMLKFHAMIAA